MGDKRVAIHEPGQLPCLVAIESNVEIGRECAGFVVNDSNVSRRHLRLSPANGRLTVLDLGSTNGTRVNGDLIDGERVLIPGDIVQLGNVEIVVIDAPRGTTRPDRAVGDER